MWGFLLLVPYLQLQKVNWNGSVIYFTTTMFLAIVKMSNKFGWYSHKCTKQYFIILTRESYINWSQVKINYIITLFFGLCLCSKMLSRSKLPYISRILWEETIFFHFPGRNTMVNVFTGSVSVASLLTDSDCFNLSELCSFCRIKLSDLNFCCRNIR